MVLYGEIFLHIMPIIELFKPTTRSSCWHRRHVKIWYLF
jgi:hypothetical protein